MESNYHNRDFEQFLKQNADQYRMFPSENVWKGIDSTLHRRRRWYGAGLALLLLLTGAGVTWVMLSYPPASQKEISNRQEISAPPPTTGTQKVSTVPADPNTVPLVQLAAPVIAGPLHFNLPVKEFGLPDAQPGDLDADQPVLSVNVHTPDARAYDPGIALVDLRNNDEAAHAGTGLLLSGIIMPSTFQVAEQAPAAEDETKPLEEKSIEQEQYGIYPLTIESVVNSYQRPRPRKAVAIQVYMAPTVSYRKLSENKAFLKSAASSGTVPASIPYRDVNNAVTHKPDLGVELGVAAKYPLSRALQLKAGLQFNVSRYGIRAFYNPGEIATIALDAGGGTNSISQETIYRNYSGQNTNWLQNLYYSASVPVGAELRFPSKKATYFSIAATAQPTFIISDKAYLLSTDYKNYVEVPSLIRRWNLNAGFEALVGFSSDRHEWQIGPQVRYQVRSSFQDQYPLKENLFDFGLKVGMLFNR